MSALITAVVITRNEAQSLPRCLKSLDFCDRVLVVDDDSSDATRRLARQAGAQVLTHPLSQNFSAQRNWALSQCHTPWVLFVDADEVVPKPLANEIRRVVSNSSAPYSGYSLPRQDFMWNRQLRFGDLFHVRLVRLAKLGVGSWQGRVHELWRISGPVGALHHPLHHYPHRNLSEFLSHINQYSTLRAQELIASNSHPSFWQIIIFPPAKFLYLYLLRFGFLDKTPGFIHAMVMAFYSFLVRGKLWLLSKGIDSPSS